jgi:predicted transposase/invertase (TIGR01784 family)
MEKNYIRFDWAVKNLLRQKVNHVVLEGLLTVLLREKIKITSLLESESNQETEDDKFNRVDMLAENDKGELLIIEVQNTREVAYFHRMIYGTSKAISERMKLGDNYSEVKKVYSINIVYFELGHGKDYIYHGKTEFRSLHNPDEILQLTATQKRQFQKDTACDIFPEYYVIRVEEFDKLAADPLDEWISFLKTSKIPDNTTTPGLKEAREIMALNTMSEKERRAYERHLENLRYQKSVMETQRIEGIEEGEKIGIEKGEKIGIKKVEVKVIVNAFRMGMSIEDIATLTGLTTENVIKILKQEKLI